MGYVLDGTTIRSPHGISERNSTIVAQNRTLDGSISRDYMGSNKRVWRLEYRNVNVAEYNAIYNIYSNFLITNTAVSFESTETNYIISSTNVHVDMPERTFRVKGEDYISDFILVLTEV